MLKLYKICKMVDDKELQALHSFLENRRILSIQDLATRVGLWIKPNGLVSRIKITWRHREDEYEVFAKIFLSISSIAEKPLVVYFGWMWEGEANPKPRWNHLNKTWYSCLKAPHDEFLKLNKRWRQTGSIKKWKAYWRPMWRGWILPKTHMYLWRILQHVLFNNNKAKHWRVSNRLCPCCGIYQETIEHLFSIVCLQEEGGKRFKG